MLSCDDLLFGADGVTQAPQVLPTLVSRGRVVVAGAEVGAECHLGASALHDGGPREVAFPFLASAAGLQTLCTQHQFAIGGAVALPQAPV